MSRVNTAVARPVRTGIQGSVGLLIVEALEAFDVADFSDEQYGIAAIILTALVSAVQNLAENKGWLKPFLRNVHQTVPVGGTRVHEGDGS